MTDPTPPNNPNPAEAEKPPEKPALVPLGSDAGRRIPKTIQFRRIATDTISASEYQALTRGGLDAFRRGFVKPWSRAQRTKCRQYHTHASKAEAATCDRLTIECFATKATLYQQVRVPLFALGSTKRGRVPILTVDFAIQERGDLFPTRFIDTKGRISRGWRERAMAFKQTYGMEIEEVRK